LLSISNSATYPALLNGMTSSRTNGLFASSAFRQENENSSSCIHALSITSNARCAAPTSCVARKPYKRSRSDLASSVKRTRKLTWLLCRFQDGPQGVHNLFLRGILP